jgi:hypothetical protein
MAIVSPRLSVMPERTHQWRHGRAGFGWDSCEQGDWYGKVHSKIDAISKLGVTLLWLPPPSKSVSLQGYMPSALYNLDTPYGSELELKELLKALKCVGIRALADIVINHRCADEQDDKGIWNIFGCAALPQSVVALRMCLLLGCYIRKHAPDR